MCDSFPVFVGNLRIAFARVVEIEQRSEVPCPFQGIAYHEVDVCFACFGIVGGDKLDLYGIDGVARLDICYLYWDVFQASDGIAFVVKP